MIQITPYQGLGINYGHTFPESRGLSDPVGCQNSLNELWGLGFRKIRWNIQLYTNSESEFDEFKAAIEKALAMGFYCIFGTHHVGSTMTLTQQNGVYLDRITNLATWMSGLLALYPAQLELCVGNEDDQTVDGSTLTKAAHQLWLATTMPDAVHAINANLKVSHATHSSWQADWWALFQAGNFRLDRISMQFYNIGLAMGWVRSNKNVFGDKFYMSEWSTYNDGGIYGRNNYFDDEAWFFDFARFYALHRKLEIDSYYFFWTGAAADVPTQGFAMKKTNGTYATALKKILLNPLRPKLTDSPYGLKGVTTKSAKFNGTTSKIVSPIVIDRTSFNIGVWVYNDRSVLGSNGNTYPILEAVATNPNNRFGLRTDPNSNGLYFYTANNNVFTYTFPVGGNAHAVGRWRLYVLQYVHGQGTKLYQSIHGKMELTAQNALASMGVIDTGLTLMNRSTAFRRGYLSNLIIENGSLWSEETIDALYDDKIIPEAADGYYPFNGDSQDYSGNGNHATPTAITYSNNSPF